MSLDKMLSEKLSKFYLSAPLYTDGVGRHIRRGGGSYIDFTNVRVSFKNPRPNRYMSRNLILVNLDKDISMTGNFNNNTRQVIINQRDRDDRAWQTGYHVRNSSIPNRNFKGGQSGFRPRPLSLGESTLGESSWYRIIIPYGHKYEKDFIINTLLNYIAPEVFVPIMYKIMRNEASFYVDDHKTAKALLNCDRKITLRDGFHLHVRAKPGFLFCEIDDKLKELLKKALVKRFVQETNALDLSKFHFDPDLVSDYFCALFNPAILMTVLDIVAKHIPNLEALNLEGNKLQNIERLRVLTKKFLKLKILYVSDNKIRDIRQLDAIKDLQLDELKLTGNPICNKYKFRHSDYVSDVRQRFPKLRRLDDIELPIVFDVAEAAKIPPSQRMFVTDPKAQEIASQFLQQYFMIFDSGNRQPLLDAYDERACFSMTTSYNNNLYPYLTENRNIIKINDTIKREKLLKHGKLPVVSFISQMPRTKHLLNTFTMDIDVVMQAMMFITLTGYYQELDNKGELIRSFNRTFIIIPKGVGYCILNEQLHVSQPSETHLKQLHQQLNQLNNKQIQPEAPAPMPAPAAALGPITQPMETELGDSVKQQMMIMLNQQTSMNMEWSFKCLQETQWNYNDALCAFQEFYKRGQIPPEAFTK